MDNSTISATLTEPGSDVKNTTRPDLKGAKAKTKREMLKALVKARPVAGG
jgi:hypothetical protein